MDHITNFADLTHLDNAKFQILQNTVKSILTSTIAEDSFAQIIDGQPTRLSFEKNFNYDRPLYDAAGVSEATEPSPKSLQLFRTIRADFALQGLKINAQVAQAYQNAPRHSREEDLRLLEISAASVHSLAAMIYASFHPETDINPHIEGPDFRFGGSHHYYVDFYHKCYKMYGDYPYALLNVVGYWMETQLFGGVVLFERGTSGLESKNAYIHEQNSTQAFQLLEGQINEFSALAERQNVADPLCRDQTLPFSKLPNASNIGPSDMQRLNVYKNDYDIGSNFVEVSDWRCVRRDPELLEELKKIRQGLDAGYF